MKKSGRQELALSLGFLFASLKISYASESSLINRRRSLVVKRGEEKIRLLESGNSEPVGKDVQPPLELIFLLLKSFQKVFLTIISRLRVIFGLPI